MKIALTGATGFLGRYLVRTLVEDGHELRCWKRESSDLSGLESQSIDWIPGTLDDEVASNKLIAGCDALVHAALWRPSAGFRGAEGDLPKFAQRNVIGSLRLFQLAHEAKLSRVVYVSSCAVHEVILGDRPLDETHPMWAKSHYGAHKAAVESFVYSYGLGQEMPICAIRPTGIYGVNRPKSASKWYSLIRDVAAGNRVTCNAGGKEVHVSDVARAISLLLRVTADKICGQSFACYDRYISDYEVASIAKEISGSGSIIDGQPKSPKSEIDKSKLQALGFSCGGTDLLRRTISDLLSDD